MAELPKGRDPKKPSDVAAAEGLFEDAPARAPKRPQVSPGEVEGFELADAEPAPAVSRPAVPAWEMDAEPVSQRPRAARRSISASEVDQIWTRGAEWGPELVVLGLWALLILFLLYLTLGGGYYMMALTVLALGVLGGGVLCYPLFITMERPVRMSPERAAKDFYEALSHHRPHYRRMWLLLSNAGRISSKFASYEGFRQYWTDTLKRLKSGRAGATTPLMFQVSGFQDQKDEEKTVADASWTVSVYVRGQREQGPIETLTMESTFSKGPDGMWYLDQGTFEARPAGRGKAQRGGEATP